ncbi:MAG: HAD-IA family hydrolase [Candidatus Altiarchaeales archaeon]|nr:HAD-IA family hydrolase [Candidatus Altiarchaeales archaeon]MBD3416008.1 HAD-IA family hydrolase [Candidatus Altiarchaeales archaeon]
MTYEAVLFDMDGTLVDSIPAWHKTFNDVLEYTGGDKVGYETFCQDILGQSTEEDVSRFFPNLSPGELVELYDEFFPNNIGSVTLFPETDEVLEYLSRKNKLKVIVTNTPRELMHLTLETVGLTGRFDGVFGGDDVAVGKPEPDLIHHACKAVRVKESDSVMVGDTKADIGAGGAAGCTTVGIGVDGDHRIESLGELMGLLEGL